MKQDEEPSERLVSSDKRRLRVLRPFSANKKKLVETKLTREVMGTKSRDPTFRVPHTQKSMWPSLFRLK